MEDGITRWIEAEGAFRVLAARSTSMVREAARVADCERSVTSVYGSLLTGAALMELAQAPIDRLQVSLEHGGAAGTLLADVWPGPVVRGRIEHARPGVDRPFGHSGTVQVSRQPARGGRLYQSHAPIMGADIADALQHYMVHSEQVLTFFGLSTVVEPDGNVRIAGGMLVQALPGMKRTQLRSLTECLERARFDDLVTAGDDPLDATEALLSGLAIHRVGTDRILYRCRCSRDKAVGAVTMLGDDVVAAVRAGATEEVTCEFCKTRYHIGREDFEAAG